MIPLLLRDIVMIPTRRLCAGLAALLVASACATTRPPLVHQACGNADARLGKLLQQLEAERAKGCEGSGDASDCERLRGEIERLTLVCPGHIPTLTANAAIAYDQRQPEQSQQWLDQILAEPRSHPDAAVLRARIAVEAGNLPFARRLLEQQIKFAPDHAGLHETYAATLYLQRQLADATRELTIAAALGAPRWRIAYHLGLVAEAAGQLEEARRQYTAALEANPGWAIAQSRLKGLRIPEPPR